MGGSHTAWSGFCIDDAVKSLTLPVSRVQTTYILYKDIDVSTETNYEVLLSLYIKFFLTVNGKVLDSALPLFSFLSGDSLQTKAH